MFKLLFLKFFAKNLDSILSLFVVLDEKLDAYIAQQEAEVKDLDHQIGSLVLASDAKQAEIDRAAAVKNNLKALTRG